jgi:transcriptional regulator with XRE-family HTH domain
MKTPAPSPLRQLRRAAVLTLEQVAFAAGISASTLSAAERGYRALQPDVHGRIERLLLDLKRRDRAAAAYHRK